MKLPPDIGARIGGLLDQAIMDEVFPGAVVGIADREGEQIVIARGKLTYDEEAPTVVAETVYDVASITKTVPTALLANWLLDQGRLKLTDKLTDYVSEYRGDFANEITIENLLTYSVAFDIGAPMASYKTRKADELIHDIFIARVRNEPGSVYYYCNATAVLLGLIIERIVGTRLDEVARQVLFEPMGMLRTGFFPSKIGIGNHMMAPTEIDPERGGDVVGFAHDESTWMMMNAGLVVGCSGLFSTAPDLLQVVRLVLAGGVMQRGILITRGTIDDMISNHLDEKVTGRKSALGWEMGHNEVFGRFSSDRTVGKTGFTGCLLAIDPVPGIGVVILSNRTYPHRPDGKHSRNQVFTRIMDEALSPTQNG